MVNEVIALRAEYKRKYGREHPKSCEEADPHTECKCGCSGKLRGVARQGKLNELDLMRWISSE